MYCCIVGGHSGRVLLDVYLYVSLSVCLSESLSVYMAIQPLLVLVGGCSGRVLLDVCLYVSLSVCLSVYLSILHTAYGGVCRRMLRRSLVGRVSVCLSLYVRLSA